MSFLKNRSVGTLDPLNSKMRYTLNHHRPSKPFRVLLCYFGTAESSVWPNLCTYLNCVDLIAPYSSQSVLIKLNFAFSVEWDFDVDHQGWNNIQQIPQKLLLFFQFLNLDFKLVFYLFIATFSCHWFNIFLSISYLQNCFFFFLYLRLQIMLLPLQMLNDW